MSKRLEALRKREITLLIIKSIALFIMSTMAFIGAFIIRSKDSEDGKAFALLISASIFIFIIMIINILYEYFKFLKKD